MSELVDFLRQRLDEDEQAAREGASALDVPPSWPDYQTFDGPDIDAAYGYLNRFGPARLLAEAEPKRQILTEHYGFHAPGGTPTRACRRCSDRRTDDDPLSHGSGGDMWAKLEPAPCLTVRLLAEVCSDHPEYRKEWRP